MQLSVQSGVQNNQDGNPFFTRGGKQGEMSVSELHGRYYEQTYRGNMFGGAVSGVALSAALSTAYGGLVLVNPTGSKVNLVLNKVSWAPLVAQTAALSLGLLRGFNINSAVTLTTPVSAYAKNGQAIAGQGVGQLASAATLPTAPVLDRLLGSLLTGALTVATQGGTIIDLEGSEIVPPGGYVGFYGSVASVAASLAFGMDWEEVPL